MVTKDTGIGIRKESTLHHQLKEHFTVQGGKNEVPMDGYLCDIVNPGNKIVEIQTKQLSSLYTKLVALLPHYKVTVIHPIAQTKYIQKATPDTKETTERKSPRHGTYTDIFAELTKVYPLLLTRNFTLKVILISVREYQVNDGTGSWRRKGARIDNRELIEISEERTFKTVQDYQSLIPSEVPEVFTVKDLKKNGFKSPGKSAWVLRHMGIITLNGKSGRSYTYRRTPYTKNESSKKNSKTQ